MISIVIPVYNRVESLVRAINSVLCQNRWDMVSEIIVVDDGSDMDIAGAVLNVGDQSRVHLVRHERNRGVCAAKNTGIEMASGEFVVLLDSDDILFEGAVEYLVDFLGEHPEIDVLFCQSVTENGRMLGRMPEDLCSYRTMLNVETVGEYLPVVRKSVMSKYPFFEDLRGFEGLTWLRIAQAGFKVYYSNAVLRGYDDRGEDRLCHPNNIESDAHRLAQGYSRHLSLFGQQLYKYSPESYFRLGVKLAFYSVLGKGRNQDLDLDGVQGPRWVILALLCLCSMLPRRFVRYLWSQSR